MKIKRRDFLKMGAGAGVAVALGGGFWRWSQFPSQEKALEPGIEKWVPTVCAQCGGAAAFWSGLSMGGPLTLRETHSIRSIGERSVPKGSQGFRVSMIRIAFNPL
jgi:anaerobic selenocysteine-containing dehydrogenase